LGLAFVFNQNPLILLAIGAGFGWALLIAMFVISGLQRRRIANLEADLQSARDQADAWSRAAADASAASKAVAELFRPQIGAPSPRRKKKPGE